MASLASRASSAVASSSVLRAASAVSSALLGLVDHLTGLTPLFGRQPPQFLQALGERAFLAQIMHARLVQGGKIAGSGNGGLGGLHAVRTMHPRGALSTLKQPLTPLARWRGRGWGEGGSQTKKGKDHALPSFGIPPAARPDLRPGGRLRRCRARPWRGWPVRRTPACRYRQIGQHLAVDLDGGLLQAVDQAGCRTGRSHGRRR
jgi:hypothetical protein